MPGPSESWRRPHQPTSLVVEGEEHRVRPQERAGGGPHFSTHGSNLSGWSRWSCDCSGSSPSGARARRPIRASRASPLAPSCSAPGRAAPSAGATRRRRSTCPRGAGGRRPRAHRAGHIGRTSVRSPRNGSTSRLASRRSSAATEDDPGRPLLSPARCRRGSRHGSRGAPPTSRCRARSAPASRYAAVPRAGSPSASAAPWRSPCLWIAHSQRPQPSCWGCGQSLPSRSPSSV